MQGGIFMQYKYFLYSFIILFFTLLNSSNAPIHILFVLDTFPCNTKTVIVNQAIGLLEKGFYVSILSKQRGSSDEPIHPLLKNVYWGSIEQFDLNSIDVIICQYGSLGKECASHLKNNKRVKLVTFFRGSDITSIRETASGEYDTLFFTGDLFLPVCSYFAYLLTTLGCDPKKVLVQASGIDCNKFKFRQKVPNTSAMRKTRETIRIISVNRLIEKKGCKYALQAIKRLINSGYSIDYTIVGDGKQRDILINSAKKLGIEKNVHFLGSRSNEEVALLLQNSHIFLLPSVTCPNGSQEGIPNALKEAMAMGLPVISTYHAGIRELIKHGETGFLSPERDAHSLEKNIKYLIEHPKIWHSITHKARLVIESLYDTVLLNNVLAQRIKKIVSPST